MTAADSCTEINSIELLRLCSSVEKNIESLTTLPWITAFFSLLTGLLVAWVTVRANRAAQNRERHNIAQRTALLEVQEAALKLRHMWRVHLQFLTTEASQSTEDNPPSALQDQFHMLLTRIDNPGLRNVYLKCEEYAQALFNDDPLRQEFIELELWRKTLDRSGVIIRWLDV